MLKRKREKLKSVGKKKRKDKKVPEKKRRNKKCKKFSLNMLQPGIRFVLILSILIYAVTLYIVPNIFNVP